jgi:pyrroloquinoline quinone biosynthesis protein D
MPVMADRNDAAQPRLARGVRLHFDVTREAWVLLAPERIIETDGPVHDIVKRCDGAHSVQAIVDELVALYAASAEEITGDVHALLDELVEKRLIVL